jgi:hypothetical protein
LTRLTRRTPERTAPSAAKALRRRAGKDGKR